MNNIIIYINDVDRDAVDEIKQFNIIDIFFEFIDILVDEILNSSIDIFSEINIIIEKHTTANMR